MRKQIYAEEFVERFMTGSLEHLKHQLAPVKIFQLSEIAPYIKSPTPPIILGYNLLVYISEGHFDHQIGPKTYVVNSPAVLISNYGNVSAIKSVDRSAKGYCVLIRENVMTSLFREQEILNIFHISPVLNLDGKGDNELSTLFALLYAEAHDTAPYKVLVESLLKSLLLKIIKLSGEAHPLSRKQQIAMAFKELVHKNFQEHKTPSFYAEKLKVSSNYLNRCVYAVFMKSSKDIILEVLIMRSQILLAESNKSVADISYELNFSDPSYFARIFRKNVGVSPTTYRKSVRPH